MPSLQAVSTTLPEHTVSQAALREVAESVLPETAPARDQMLEAFENSAIERRGLAMELGWYLEDHGHAERNRAYLDVGLGLATEAAGHALATAGLAADEVDAVVFVSSTGIATPSMEARLAGELGFRADVTRLPIWGLGCAGGVAGLNRAADLARAKPEAHVLLVSLELCSLTFSLRRALGGQGEESLDKKTMIAATLFGDGCAAAVLDGPALGSPGPSHLAGASHLFPDTERVMGWDVLDDTLDVVLSPRIPAIAGEHLAPIVHGFLDEALAPGARPDRWVLHPGGAKVLEAYAKALGLDEAEMGPARRALREHGNMSSPTVLFALEDVLSNDPGPPGGTLLLGALGPGFASELSLLEV